MAPLTAPLRTPSAKASILRRSARTSGITSTPAARIGAPLMLRNAMWSAGRSSVLLTISPAKSASRRSSTFAARARSKSSESVVRSTRCLEKSKRISPSSTWKSRESRGILRKEIGNRRLSQVGAMGFERVERLGEVELMHERVIQRFRFIYHIAGLDLVGQGLGGKICGLFTRSMRKPKPTKRAGRRRSQGK